jgi:hypothetical protein
MIVCTVFDYQLCQLHAVLEVKSLLLFTRTAY